ncbi:hypothetical protein DSM25559_4494 [Agrobacterium rosae]|uniref:Uncharacterized protein n=1 Tax=Agrobacterium rosae TaxID=1972867 RepID=A0A1R3U0T9_9HYPH|nr:hypothetical protein DSM25559_4494 [Agrobacterium rosae]
MVARSGRLANHQRAMLFDHSPLAEPDHLLDGHGSCALGQRSPLLNCAVPWPKDQSDPYFA